MNALVLCGGFGTRLGDLCRDRPKPLLQVGDRAIIEHILCQLRDCGFSRVFINLHHQSEALIARLSHGERFGLQIEYVREPELRGTAGTARDVLTRLACGSIQKQPSELLVHYGDVVTDHDLAALVAEHRTHRGAVATMVVHQRLGSNSHVTIASDGRVRQFLERPATIPPTDPQTPPWAFSGICVLSPDCIVDVPADGVVDLPRDCFGGWVASGRLFATPLAGHRVAVDSPSRLEQARTDWRAGRFRWAQKATETAPIPLDTPVDFKIQGRT